MKRLALLLLLAAGQDSPPRVASFACDVSPPAGSPMAGGLLKAVESVEAPLLAKGLVLEEGRARYVLCALDWCRLHNESFDLFRKKISAAVETPESNVAVHCLHQHDAPVADTGAQRALDAVPGAPKHLDLADLEKAAGDVAAAARAALPKLRPFTRVGYGRAKVEGVASTRRILTDDGKIRVRSSYTKDPSLHAAPEGKIDPWIRTVTLLDGAKPLARLHYYACHPQNNYGDGIADPDMFEPVRARFEKEEGIPHLYFAGCGGDVTVGKYNVGTPGEVRARLVERLSTGIRGAIADTRTAPVSGLGWKVAEVRFPPKAELSEESLRKRMADAALDAPTRVKAAWGLSWLDRLKAKPAVEVSRLRLGPVWILHLPGECFVEYQLWAQGVRPDDFVAVAAYGDGGTGYVCTDEAFQQGGYEPTVSHVGPPTERLLKEAIANLLR